MEASDEGRSTDNLLINLRKSYDALPTDQHRLMFLDAAIMCEGRPVSHLAAVWEGNFLLDLIQTSLLPSQRNSESSESYQLRKTYATAWTVRRLIDDLCDSALITCDLAAGKAPLSSR